MIGFVEITVEGPRTRRQLKDIEVIDSDEEYYINGLIDTFLEELDKKVEFKRKMKQFYRNQEPSSSTETARDERSHTPS